MSRIAANQFNLEKYKELYEEKKLIDDAFDKLYDSDCQDVIKKTLLALLVELGELANETNCFKYWIDKKPSPDPIILEEYADCMLMAMFFCRNLDISLDENFDEVKENTLVEQFIYLYRECSSLLNDYRKERVKSILVNLIYLGYLMGYDDTQLVDAGLSKIKKNKLRFVGDFQ